ncbi:hypothetical protein HBI13_202810 [Parastagonospora nodorum]|nr:hypothetical protein HBI10_208630 [Parastagonospora nodorum]KAH4010794.1 hypothetical protein HBI13_202810 [Parastagonospora nodorum]KAH4216580.1 hypothetical protein HBI06_226830 [Parastagonospora nodorum]KAH4225528.1 hypothetical protein HBI05_225460 [Parastagonospora nodorum]KAH5655632.1 hypothetical protein HBI51_048000 [Parastagonospora nodorum]
MSTLPRKQGALRTNRDVIATGAFTASSDVRLVRTDGKRKEMRDCGGIGGRRVFLRDERFSPEHPPEWNRTRCRKGQRRPTTNFFTAGLQRQIAIIAGFKV